MNFTYLIPSGNPVETEVLFENDDDGRSRIRKRYASLACAKCGKVDEYAALSLGVDPNVIVRTKKDYFGTFDHFDCVSQRLRAILEQANVSGVGFVELPKSRSYSILVPKFRVHVDLATSAMQFRRKPCPICGRYQESTGYPPLRSMELPTERLVMFMPDFLPEKSDARMAVWIASEDVVKLLQDANITGIDWDAF